MSTFQVICVILCVPIKEIYITYNKKYRQILIYIFLSIYIHAYLSIYRIIYLSILLYMYIYTMFPMNDARLLKHSQSIFSTSLPFLSSDWENQECFSILRIGRLFWKTCICKCISLSVHLKTCKILTLPNHLLVKKQQHNFSSFYS